MTMTMNDSPVNTVVIDSSLVHRLIASQLPEWSGLPLERVDSAGTDHTLFRLGADRVVRMPRVDAAIEQADKEQEWLPQLAPHLPLAIPVPLAKGLPGEGYPRNWSVCRWLDGENAIVTPVHDRNQAALDLAEFILALQKIDGTNGPLAGRHNFCRGVPLNQRDLLVRSCLDSLKDLIDTTAAAKLWDVALQTPVWDRPPVWVHGDIHAGNVLVVNGRIHAVIDFGGLGVGDPAVDLIVAWNLLDQPSRTIFRDTLQVDDNTWERGKGWALSIALIALPYYLHTNPTIVKNSYRVIHELLTVES